MRKERREKKVELDLQQYLFWFLTTHIILFDYGNVFSLSFAFEAFEFSFFFHYQFYLLKTKKMCVN